MGKLIVKEKDIVVPGEELAEGMDYLPVSGAFREEDKIIANQIGVVNVNGRLIKVMPLRGKYLPKKGDVVIGKIIDMSFSNWYIDIGCASNSVLSVKDATEFVERGADLSQFYSFGDMIVARVNNVIRGSGELTMRGPGLRKLGNGRILNVSSSKVPRIIGKQGSMISAIKEKTGCRIIVGQNGIVWIYGEPKNEMIAVEAIEFVNTNAHKSGLTDTVTKMLEKNMKGVPVPKESFKEDDNLYREQRQDDSYGRDSRGGRPYGGDNRGRRPYGGDNRGRRPYGGDNRGGRPYGGDNRRDFNRSGQGYQNRSVDERRDMRDARKRIGRRQEYGR